MKEECVSNFLPYWQISVAFPPIYTVSTSVHRPLGVSGDCNVGHADNEQYGNGLVVDHNGWTATDGEPTQ
jgi:hypothetical protein